MKGHVIIKNENGEIIVDKDNMILNYGSEILYKLFLSNICKQTGNDVDGILKIAFLTSGAVSANDSDTIDLNNVKNAKILKIGDDNTRIEPNIKDYSIKFCIQLKTDGSEFSFNSLGLVLEENSISKLFTRIAFDNTYLSAENSSFNIDYYLYF